jgi:hypothetical protein
MARLIGLLSFYDEKPSWLAACISSYAQAGLTHLVAIDGAYRLYPDGQARSTPDAHDTIVETTGAIGLHLTLVLPTSTWQGNEIQKRTSLFRHADAIAQPDRDWLLVIDADEIVTRALTGWLNELTNTTLDTADVLLWSRDQRDTPEQAQVDQDHNLNPVDTAPIRKLFRHTPGIHCHKNHYTYVTPDQRVLWRGGRRNTDPSLDLTDHIHIEHRSIYRTLHRRAASADYYATRDQTGIETPA